MKDQVKNLEIYRMPDGKDYFAARGQKNTYFLYPVIVVKKICFDPDLLKNSSSANFEGPIFIEFSISS